MGFPGTEQRADVADLNSERRYKRFAAHSNTVAGNEVLVLEAARRFAAVDVFGLNPGFVKTDIRANLPSPSSAERSYATALMDASDRLIARLAP
ncbi:hypothetical protein JEY40_10800 [Bradyrhizobium japonicum]|uniref:hypothetical protein n=1 Tax=Bradyrhizobium japonicum TaxID=375 RepID=UPI00200FC10D|nr:hypothetical protein [Bradyrhizobium japonicum]UQD74950.1 hypothetical protein JEY40_10800 [Bradyrhizobium japonicum]